MCCGGQTHLPDSTRRPVWYFEVPFRFVFWSQTVLSKMKDTPENVYTGDKFGVFQQSGGVNKSERVPTGTVRSDPSCGGGSGRLTSCGTDRGPGRGGPRCRGFWCVSSTPSEPFRFVVDTGVSTGTVQGPLDLPRSPESGESPRRRREKKDRRRQFRVLCVTDI